MKKKKEKNIIVFIHALELHGTHCDKSSVSTTGENYVCGRIGPDLKPISCLLKYDIASKLDYVWIK